MQRLVLAAALLLLVSHGLLRAQDVHAPATGAPATAAPAGEGQAAPSSAEPPDALPMERYGETDKACMRWGDGCRTCGRGVDGAVTCSNIGIACQPGAVTCAGSQPAPAGK